MKPDETITSLNASRGHEYWIRCSRCRADTRHVILQSVDVDGTSFNGDDDYGYFVWERWQQSYQIIKCQGCDTISFRHQIDSSDDVPGDCIAHVYPKPRKRESIIFWSYPPSVRDIYRESIDALNNQAHILCAVGLRATIESICADQGVVDGPVERPAKGGGTQICQSSNLDGKISGLHKRGVLTETHAALLNQHRYLGNDAVHELEKPSMKELNLALDIIEHVLQSLYEIPQKGQSLDKSRVQRKNGK